MTVYSISYTLRFDLTVTIHINQALLWRILVYIFLSYENMTACLDLLLTYGNDVVFIFSPSFDIEMIPKM